MRRTASDRKQGLVAAAAVAAAIALRFVLPLRPIDSVGPASLLESAYAIFVAGSLALLALAIGDSLLSRFGLGTLTALEQASFSLGLGLGIVGTLMLVLGLVGALRPSWVALSVLAGYALFHRRVGGWLGRAGKARRQALQQWRELTLLWKLLTALMVWIGVVVLLISLAPPSAYDALMYHLLGPSRFLQQGSVFPSLNRWWINFPFLAEMGYAVPLALRAESAASLLHLMWGALFLTTTIGLARRWADAPTARWATAIVLGMPLLAIVAADADTDFVWSTLELLSLMAILAGVETRRRGWMVLAGTFAGMALGAKYLSFVGLGTLAILLAWLSLRQGRRATVASLGLFLLPAVLVAAPWYLKNWIWLGDPLFPYWIGGWRLDPPRMWAASQIAVGFARPSSVTAWLILPLRMFIRPWEFGSSFPPSLLLLGVLFFPFVPRSRPLNAIGALVLAWYLLWTVGPGLIARYLVPAVPLAAIVSAYAVGRFPFPVAILRPGRILVIALVATSLISTALILTGIALQDRVLAVVTGAISRDDYLRRVIPTYAAVAFARSHLPAGSTLLSTGDGRAYYCQDLCYDSDDQTLWLNLALQAATPADFAVELHRRGVTHLLYSPGDMRFFQDFVPGDSAQRATSFLVDEFLPACGTSLYTDENAALYAVDC